MYMSIKGEVTVFTCESRKVKIKGCVRWVLIKEALNDLFVLFGVNCTSRVKKNTAILKILYT